MPVFKYSFKGYDPITHVRASGREVDFSPKAAREACTTIKGKLLPDAKSYLERVSEMKEALPLRRYNKEVGHRRQLQGFHSGAYPVKTVKGILEILNNLEANAGFKGMNTDRLQIIHAAAHRGLKVKNYTPRAQGRSSPSYNILTHIELVAKEV
ncbi:MAG: 50S ribosomal protein L22 [Thaumarchaeota archaeon]|nr:50S ribosomal protein L22 [Nitrososphaerota archaeon]